MPSDTEQEDRDSRDEADKAKDMAIIRSHAVQLSEHFDSVQILCTKKHASGDGTTSAVFGQGDWYARYGHAKYWIKQQEKNEEL